MSLLLVMTTRMVLHEATTYEYLSISSGFNVDIRDYIN